MNGTVSYFVLIYAYYFVSSERNLLNIINTLFMFAPLRQMEAIF